MPNAETKVTDSWKAYEISLGAIERFLTEIRIQDGEAWVGDVCFGSPGQPLIRAPLRRESAALVRDAVGCAEQSAANVIESIHRAVETSLRVLEELKAKGDVDKADVSRVIGRIDSMERLRAELEGAARGGETACLPAQLLHWSEILRRSFVEGEPAIRIKVVTTYLL